ncbi:DUF7332 family protein [Halobaculum magnesiiphilum]|uniref:Uncharacterized protein n=1 Tax=Halobaculum magnesiiphilum TaxID=1017351 RepID=A0A8T8WCI0_9EURY|nr:hypothetical protein [Halobaculum magnesiiphilum]QZP37506.1 hypothetical protein K6T50_14710 [Halobaculum magnesiiphilum]
MSHRFPVRVAFALLVSLAAVGGPAVAPAAAAPEDCFGDGRDLDVGTEGPTIDLSIYTSLFTNLGGKGALGMSAVGHTGEYEVISLRTGVVFAGVSDPEAFLADPFSRFAIAFDYTLSLPMLSAAPGDSTYEQSEAPVEGVPEAECSVE